MQKNIFHRQIPTPLLNIKCYTNSRGDKYERNIYNISTNDKIFMYNKRKRISRASKTVLNTKYRKFKVHISN